MCCVESECEMCSVILQRFDEPPTCRIRLVREPSDSEEAAQLTIKIAEHILRLQPGVMAGVFDIVLDADELAGALRPERKFVLY